MPTTNLDRLVSRLSTVTGAKRRRLRAVGLFAVLALFTGFFVAFSFFDVLLKLDRPTRLAASGVSLIGPKSFDTHGQIHRMMPFCALAREGRCARKDNA